MLTTEAASPIEVKEGYSIQSTRQWSTFLNNMGTDIKRIGRDAGTITIPQWITTILIAGLGCLLTYAFTVGSKYGQFEQMTRDMQDIKTHMTLIDARIEVLSTSRAVSDSQASQMKQQMDTVERKQDEILSKLMK